MKKIAFTILVLLAVCAAPTVFGQDEEEKKTEELGPRESWMLRDLTRRLELSDAQQEEIKKALLASSKATQEAIKKTLTPMSYLAAYY